MLSRLDHYIDAGGPDPAEHAVPTGGLDAAGTTTDAGGDLRLPLITSRRIHAPTAVGRVGVLFVRGVGSQPQRRTVREFATPLLRWLSEWHRARRLPLPQVVASDLSCGNDLGRSPARFELLLHTPDDVAALHVRRGGGHR